MGVAENFKVESESVGGSFIKSSDLDNGMALRVVSMEVFTPDDAKYGVKNEYGPGGVVTKENWFIKKGLLKEGQSFRYTFKSGATERVFENSSLGFYFAFTNLNPNAGDEVWIKRNAKSQTEIDWVVEMYHDQYGMTNEADEMSFSNPMN